MVDARKVAGWVTTPDGQRLPCPRCEGEAFLRLNGVRMQGVCTCLRPGGSPTEHGRPVLVALQTALICYDMPGAGYALQQGRFLLLVL